MIAFLEFRPHPRDSACEAEGEEKAGGRRRNVAVCLIG